MLMEYKLYVATKGCSALREVELFSEEYLTAMSLLQEPIPKDDDALMITNKNVSLDNAYIFALSYEAAEDIAQSFIYDEPTFFDKMCDIHFNKSTDELIDFILESGENINVTLTIDKHGNSLLELTETPNPETTITRLFVDELPPDEE